MANLNEVKKNLFKIKKVLLSKKDWKGNIIGTEEYVAVIAPNFEMRTKTFDDNYITITTLDGEVKSLKIDCVDFKTTRITNEKIKKEVDKLIDYCKAEHKLQLEMEKLYADFEVKKSKLQDKVDKNEIKLKPIFERIEKAKGVITVNDFISKMEKELSITLSEGYSPSSYYVNEKFYGTKIGDYTLSVSFIKEKINRLVLSCEHDVCRWVTSDRYDFLYEEYDRTIHVDNLDKSNDFERLKRQYFNNCKTHSFKHNVTESYDAYVGDKDILTIMRNLEMPIKLERNKENIKDISSKMKYFLSLV